MKQCIKSWWNLDSLTKPSAKFLRVSLRCCHFGILWVLWHECDQLPNEDSRVLSLILSIYGYLAMSVRYRRLWSSVCCLDISRRHHYAQDMIFWGFIMLLSLLSLTQSAWIPKIMCFSMNCWKGYQAVSYLSYFLSSFLVTSWYSWFCLNIVKEIDTAWHIRP